MLDTGRGGSRPVLRSIPKDSGGDHRGGNRAESTYSFIKRRIIRLEIEPGSFFTESDLAEELGTSRTPVREALARIRLEGLVEVEPRSGYRVSPVTLRDVRNLFGVRMLLEGESIVLAVRELRDFEQIRKLELVCRASFRPDDPESISEFLERNTELHVGIAKIGGNDLLASMLQHVLERLERVLHITLAVTGGPEEWVHGHEELLSALLGGDQEQAKRVALCEATRTQRKVIEALVDADVINVANVGATPPTGDRGA